MASASSDPSISYKWREISDLSGDLEDLRDRELESLFNVWSRHKQLAEYKDGLQAFSDELAREWAIETGVIEGIYTLDRGITRTLIEHGINASYIPHNLTNRDPELVARIIHGHQEALEGLFAFVKSERTLSTSYIKELHSALLRYQDSLVVSDQSGKVFETPLEKGAYKKLPNNPQRADGSVHEYCPAEHVASEMDRLVAMHLQHTSAEVSSHIEAAWLHHAFTQIHPFQDGNGRVARAISSLVFIKAGFFPLVINRDGRASYIDALEAADGGDLSVLIRLFAKLQKRELTRAIGRAADVKPVHSVDEAVQVTRDLLVDLGRIIPSEFQAAKAIASALENLTGPRLTKTMNELGTGLSGNQGFYFGVEQPPALPREELAALAKELKYDLNVNDYSAGLVAHLISHGISSQIVVSFHSVGSTFRGLLAVAAYFKSGQGPVAPLSSDVFRISYEDSRPEIEKRYVAWLDQCLINGLAEWRRSLV